MSKKSSSVVALTQLCAQGREFDYRRPSAGLEGIYLPGRRRLTACREQPGKMWVVRGKRMYPLFIEKIGSTANEYVTLKYTKSIEAWLQNCKYLKKIQ